MKTGRPRKPRSRLLAGIGGPMTAGERKAIMHALAMVYERPPRALLDAIDDARASYYADADALERTVGAAEETRDMAAIAVDCRDLINRANDPLEDTTTLRLRLLDRLHEFPPTADAMLSGEGIDVWPHLEHLRNTLHRPRAYPLHALVPDLAALASAVDQCPPLPRVTRPRKTARARLQRKLADALEAHPSPDDAGMPVEALKLDRRRLTRRLLEALGVKMPKR